MQQRNKKKCQEEVANALEKTLEFFWEEVQNTRDKGVEISVFSQKAEEVESKD